jgi:hypothetical protein
VPAEQRVSGWTEAVRVERARAADAAVARRQPAAALGTGLSCRTGLAHLTDEAAARVRLGLDTAVERGLLDAPVDAGVPVADRRRRAGRVEADVFRRAEHAGPPAGATRVPLGARLAEASEVDAPCAGHSAAAGARRAAAPWSRVGSRGAARAGRARVRDESDGAGIARDFTGVHGTRDPGTAR